MYATDYDDRLPLAAHWEDGLYDYHKNKSLLACPERPDVEPGYAYNLSLNQRFMKEAIQKSQTPALFESSLGLHDGADLLQSFARPHGFSPVEVGAILFLDGHVALMGTPPSASAGLASRNLYDRPVRGEKL